jgi:threonine aldolase
MVKGGIASLPLATAASMVSASERQGRDDLATLRQRVKFTGDGPQLTPPEAVDVLGRIVNDRGIDADYYSRGGVVTELEERMAAILGKERAVFVPTGTLANHLAVRTLAGNDRRVAVQYESHLYNDSGDCAEVLSNLNLVPLAHGGGTFTVQDLEELFARTASGRVTTGLGVIAIESPIRRRLGELFDYDEMKRINRFAREHGIRTHLDGARLFMASGYTGISPCKYASLFDTVYVSMWKYFNAPSGAILAGPSALLDDLYHPRRMFGSALPQAWPLAAMALDGIDGFEERFAAGVRASEELITALEANSRLRVERIANGSNIFKLYATGPDAGAYRARLAEAGILLPAPLADGGFALKVNETLTRRPVATTAGAFVDALES